RSGPASRSGDRSSTRATDPLPPRRLAVLAAMESPAGIASGEDPSADRARSPRAWALREATGCLRRFQTVGRRSGCGDPHAGARTAGALRLVLRTAGVPVLPPPARRGADRGAPFRRRRHEAGERGGDVRSLARLSGRCRAGPLSGHRDLRPRARGPAAAVLRARTLARRDAEDARIQRLGSGVRPARPLLTE